MIATFYSFKGGVGRSMALANVAGLLSQRGLKTLMIDFDLEAPGLERFFRVDHKAVRANPGLLDMLTAYKRSMSQPVGRTESEFRNLDRFIVPIYHDLPRGGRLHLLPAGQRGDDEQMSTYAYLLRTFDWQEFYFEWAGELFFQWLSRELNQRFDLVLVDSRTGVTEMGGVCAYQLADTVVIFCAANAQNVQGTRDVIQNFNTERVRALRKDRVLDVIVVPARVQQHSRELDNFRREFESFEKYLPAALKDAGLTFWDLMIPYNPEFAFEERVVTELSGDDHDIFRRAFSRLALAVTLLAKADGPVGETAKEISAELQSRSVTELPANPSLVVPAPEYNPAAAFAGYDAFISYNSADRAVVERVVLELQTRGKKVFAAYKDLLPGQLLAETLAQALADSQALVALIGAKSSEWQLNEMTAAVARLATNPNYRLIPVLLPGSSPDSVPLAVRSYQWLDFRDGLEGDAIDLLCRGIEVAPRRRRTVETVEENPYPGLRSFAEADSRFFFGRRAVAKRAVDHLQEHRFLAIVGASGSGKTGLVMAGIVPLLRTQSHDGNDLIVVPCRPGTDPLGSLAEALQRAGSKVPPEALREELRTAPSLPGDFAINTCVVLVVDQLEELWVSGNTSDRDQYLKLLASVEPAESSQVSVIVILRADFYASAATQPAFAEMLSRNQLLLSQMTREELREAIEGPARATGVGFEPGLVERIVSDIGDSQNPLPLLQMLLSRLWQERRQGYITHESYERLGGVKILGQTAEEVYSTLHSGQKKIAEKVFLRLVSRLRTRVAVRLDEFSETERPVIERFVRASLLAVGRSEEHAVVELAQDAIMTGWARLAGWIDQFAETLRRRQEIETDASRWAASGYTSDYLYRGSALTAARAYVRENSEFLGADVTRFVEEGVRATRLRVMKTCAVIVASCLVVAGLGEYYLRARFDFALRWLRDASAVSLRLSTHRAIAVLPDGLAQLVNLANGSVVASLPDVASVALSPDGTQGATASRDGEISVFNSLSGKKEAEFHARQPVTTVAMSPDNLRVACGTEDGSISVWNIHDGHKLLTANVAGGPLRGLTFQSGGNILATAGDGRFVVNVTTGQVGKALTQ